MLKKLSLGTCLVVTLDWPFPKNMNEGDNINNKLYYFEQFETKFTITSC